MKSNRNTARRAPHSIRLAAAHGAACIALGIVLLCGCDDGSPRSKKPSQQPEKPAPSSSAPTTSTPAPTVTPEKTPTPTPAASAPAPATTPATPPAAAPQTPATTEKKAAVGVGKKGHYGPGIIATPASSIWAMQERLAFEALIPQAMNHFKATEGRAPKDHAEYMEKIIKANNIKLPQLPQGDRYRYDPKTEQLMVESPKPE